MIVQDADRQFVYVNEAAAQTLGFPSVEALLATPHREVFGRSDYYDEEGVHVSAEHDPPLRVLAGEEVPPTPLRVINRETGEESWRVNKPRGVRDGRGRTRLVVTVIEDITDQKRAELGQRLLACAGAALSSSLNYERTLQEVADLAVPELADSCAVSMPERHGLIKQVAVAHSDPEKIAVARSYSERYPSRTSDPQGSAQVLRDGQAQLMPVIPDELLQQVIVDADQLELLRSFGMRSAISVPMTAASGTPIGVISFVNAESGRVFGESDLELCEELGRRAGIAVENARLYTERSLFISGQQIFASQVASEQLDRIATLPRFEFPSRPIASRV